MILMSICLASNLRPHSARGKKYSQRYRQEEWSERCHYTLTSLAEVCISTVLRSIRARI